MKISDSDITDLANFLHCTIKNNWKLDVLKGSGLFKMFGVVKRKQHTLVGLPSNLQKER